MCHTYNASPVFGALGLEGSLGAAALLLPASVIVELLVELYARSAAIKYPDDTGCPVSRERWISGNEVFSLAES